MKRDYFSIGFFAVLAVLSGGLLIEAVGLLVGAEEVLVAVTSGLIVLGLLLTLGGCVWVCWVEMSES